MRSQTRPYTTEYQHINAKWLKPLLTKMVGSYSLNNENLSIEHRKLELSENEDGDRSILFTIQGKPHRIKLTVDTRSASTKLYLKCPYCKSNRESLYAIKIAYACRKCIGLHYPSQSERPKERLLRNIRNKRQTLWGNHPNVYNLCKHLDKPKYMKRKTFYSKLNKIVNLERAYIGIVSVQIDRLRKMTGIICSSSNSN